MVGFSEADSPWIPVGPDPERRNVQAQRSDPESLLHLYRNLLAIRGQRLSLRTGDFRSMESPSEDVLLFVRSTEAESTTVAVNFGSDAVQMSSPGDPLLTDGGFEPHGDLTFLGPGAAAIWDSTPPKR
ncbi:MAG: DUF3459 domain-containing protein [Acidimicrobiia bacterium]